MSKPITCLSIASAIILASASSCKKDYTCTCTTASGIVYDSQIKTTKKKAKSFCSDQQTNGRTCTLR